MKAILVILLIAGVGYSFYASGGNPVNLVKQVAIQSNYIEIEDAAGRTLTCKVTGKRGDYVQILREADEQRFLVNVNSLSKNSKNIMSPISDFNESSINEQLFQLARTSMKAEVLSIPEYCSYICPINGQRIKTQEGFNKERYIKLLRELSIPYVEKSMDAKKVSDSQYLLPEGIKKPVCVRMGDEITYAFQADQLKDAYIEAYFRSSSSTERL